ncbi:MAG: hypothetical protein RL186_1144 [Pseudomonadota bacterium]
MATKDTNPNPQAELEAPPMAPPPPPAPVHEAPSSPTWESGDVAAPAPIKRGGIGLLTALFLSSCAAVGGAYLSLFVQARPDVMRQVGIAPYLPVLGAVPQAPIAQPDPQIVAALKERVDALEAKLTARAPAVTTPQTPPAVPAQTKETAPPVAAQPVGPDTGGLSAQLQGVAGRVTAIETRLAALDPTGAGGAILAGLQADIAALKALVSGLQQQAASAPSPAVSFALVNVAEAANRSGPFMVEFETLRAALPNLAEVAALEPFARTGVPTRSLLQERFATLAPALAATQAADRKESGLVAWFRGVLSDLIKVQPAPNAAGSGSEAAMMRAKLKLDQGDLSGSADELATILGPPPQVTQWISQVRQRLELEGRISAVRAAAARVQVPSHQTSPPQAPPLASSPEPLAAPNGQKSPPPVEKNP